jgi:hypothetical protein
VTEIVAVTVEERRLKRAARREKQRQDNIGRAAKMHAVRTEREEPDEFSPAGTMMVTAGGSRLAVQDGFTGTGGAIFTRLSYPRATGLNTTQAGSRPWS